MKINISKYDRTKTASPDIAAKIAEGYLPDTWREVVGNRVADWLYSKRMSIRVAQAEMPFGTRAELQRWRTRCAEMLEPVLGEKS